MSIAAPALASAASTITNKINDARSANGKPALETYWDLTDDAGAHSQKMASQQRVFPIPNIGSVTDEWTTLSQLVAAGPNPGAIVDAWMASSSARSVILGNYNYIGVGATTDAAGIVWVAAIFMKGPPGLNDPPGTTTTSTSTTTTTSTTSPPPPTTTTTAPTTTTTTTSAPAPTTTTSAPTTTTTGVPTTTTTSLPTTTTTGNPTTSTTTTSPGASTTTTTFSGNDPGSASNSDLVLPVLAPRWAPPELIKPPGFQP